MLIQGDEDGNTAPGATTTSTVDDFFTELELLARALPSLAPVADPLAEDTMPIYPPAEEQRAVAPVQEVAR
jgi:hypothetical protein